MTAPRARALAILILFLAPAGRALAATPSEQHLAQALFDDARRLMEQKRFAEACPKLAESQRLDPGGGTLLNLAFCHAGEGKTATALVEYNESLSLAVREGRREREEIAREAIAKLEREVPRITVSVPQAARAPDLEVKVDDTALPPVAWDVSMALDPGTHTVSATSFGRAPWRISIKLAPQEQKTVEVPPPTAESPAALAPLPAPGIHVEERPLQGPQPAAWTPPERKTNPVFVGVLAGTLVATGVSAVTGIFAFSERAKADRDCLADRSFCRTTDARDAATASTTLAWISTGALIAAAVGTVALFVVPKRVAVTRTARGAFTLEATF